MTTNTPIQPESATLAVHGLAPERVWANLSPSRLVEHAVRREEGQLSDSGAFAAITSPHTGRSPKDKFVVHKLFDPLALWRAQCAGPVTGQLMPAGHFIPEELPQATAGELHRFLYA